MTLFPTVEEEAASDEVSKLYREIRSGLGATFVPNLFKTQASLSPRLLSATWGLVSQILTQGRIPREMKEMILTAISSARNCNYCEAAHLAFCKALGIDEEMECYLSEGLPGIGSEKTRAIVQFGLKCALSPKELSPIDYDGLRKEGLDDEEIAEIIAMAACSMFLNTLADSLKVPIDKPIQEMLRKKVEA